MTIAAITTNPATFNGTEAGGRLGSSVATCDMNGDGFADVAVGAVTAGNVRVFLGSASFSAASPALTITGAAGGLFGKSLTCADFNADGFADLAVGAPISNYVRIYRGAASLDNVFDQEVVGMCQQPQAGFATALGAGDFDADGFADLVVGCPNGTGAGLPNAESGEVTVHRGSALGISADLPVTLLGPNNEEAYFGVSVAGAGDVNGDGFEDVFVGANKGSGWVFLGNTGAINPTADSVFNVVGHTASGVCGGDTNVDGFADLGAVDNSQSGAWIFRGAAGSSVDGTPDSTMTQAASACRFNDLDGDGDADFLMGSVKASGLSSVAVFTAPLTASPTPARLLGGAMDENAGESID